MFFLLFDILRALNDKNLSPLLFLLLVVSLQTTHNGRDNTADELIHKWWKLQLKLNNRINKLTNSRSRNSPIVRFE